MTDGYFAILPILRKEDPAWTEEKKTQTNSKQRWHKVKTDVL